MEFGIEKESQELCTIHVGEKGLEQLREAVEELYYFEMVADDITMRSFLGRFEESSIPEDDSRRKVSLYNHITFHFEYNEDSIISANISTTEDPPLNLDHSGSMNITYSYSVIWNKVDRKKRPNFESIFFPKKLGIHWFSVLNSAVVATILIGCISIILWKVSRKDFSQKFPDYDCGWKAIHGNVFRFPPHVSLFCAVLGVGSQFLFLGTIILVSALLGLYQPHSSTFGITAYPFSLCIAGYISSSYHQKFEGVNWFRTLFFTSILFPHHLLLFGAL